MMGDFVFGVAMLIGGIMLGFWIGVSYGIDDVQKTAIKANAAHYVCNQETGDCKFEFKYFPPTLPP